MVCRVPRGQGHRGRRWHRRPPRGHASAWQSVPLWGERVRRVGPRARRGWGWLTTWASCVPHGTCDVLPCPWVRRAEPLGCRFNKGEAQRSHPVGVSAGGRLLGVGVPPASGPRVPHCGPALAAQPVQLLGDPGPGLGQALALWGSLVPIGAPCALGVPWQNPRVTDFQRDIPGTKLCRLCHS